MTPSILGRSPRLLVLALAHLGVPRVLGRAAVGHADDAHLVALLAGVERERAAHAEHLVVRVRREDEDLHPSRDADGNLSATLLELLEHERASPQRDDRRRPAMLDHRPGRRRPARSTGRARQTTSLSSPRK